ncbi:kinetochore Sim4 complex subunit Fta4 [Halenospora varia]|nr:kinetochore Sim4 complex subunit Fta4 [Halenospora varia]
MANQVPTIIDLKTSFLQTQIRALSAPLNPSQDFLSDPIAAEENTLRQKSIDDALFKLNGLLKKHNRLAYAPQALRHVAEQVDKLYWDSGERGVIGVGGEEWAERGCDIRTESIIEKLPEQWSEEAESKAPEKAARYQKLQQRLTELNEKRRAAKEKVERYKALKELLVPFEEPEINVQENLVVKGGEVEKELERMKMLMLRVQRGMGGLEKKDSRDEDEMEVDVDEVEDRKILAILGV